jgi:surface protein
MEKMFGDCTGLTSLDISTFNTSKCINFNEMFINDDGLDLYYNKTICDNLVDQIPNYVKKHDISDNDNFN